MNVEQATLEDLPQLTDLLVDLFAHQPDFRPDRAKQMRGLRLLLENPARGRIFVIRSHGRIAGMINLLFTISTAEGGLVMLLEDLIIHKDFRGQGLGTRLLEHAIEYARSRDFLRITLLSDIDEVESQKLFSQHGFTRSHMIPMRLVLSAGGGEAKVS